MPKLKKLCIRAVKFITFCVLFCGFAFTQKTIDYLTIFLNSYGNIGFYFFLAYAIVHIAPYFWKEITITNKNIGDCLHGVPIPDLLDHLFSYNSLKAADTAYRWNLHPQRHTQLAKKLLKAKVLVKGAKNANILNPSINRTQATDTINQLKTQTSTFPIFRGGKQSENHSLFSKRKL